MGLFDALKRKPVPETKRAERWEDVNAAELEPWLTKEFGPLEDYALQALARECADIEASFIDASIALEALEKAKLRAEGDACGRMNMIKASFAAKARAGLSAAPRLREKSWDGFTRFAESSRKAVHEAADVSPKQGYVLSTYFRSEGSGLSEAMRRVSANVDGLTAKMKEHAFLETLRDARLEAQRLAAMKAQRAGLERRAAELAAAMEGTERALAECKAMRDAVETGKEWKEAQDKGRALEALKSEADALETRMRAETGGIERLMKKLAHETEDRDAQEFAERPFESVHSFAKARIESLLKRAREAAEGGKLNAKESEKKRLERLAETMPSLIELRSKLAGLRKRAAGIQGELEASEALAQMRGTDETAARLERELAGLKDDAGQTGDEKDKLQTMIEEKRAYLEMLLAREGRHVRLKI